jgi:uncharacterized cysteine cluster protein YcgN (CxxCxxCC family)
VTQARFWEEKSLREMSTQEWESLCDGCAKCCLHKLEDEDTGDVYYTKVRCRYLLEDSCRCSDYERRSVLVPHCIKLSAEDLSDYHWLPATCAYRLLAEGQPLAAWHPLVSGSKESVHEAGISIRGRAISDEFVHPDGYDEHIVHWQE